MAEIVLTFDPSTGKFFARLAEAAQIASQAITSAKIAPGAIGNAHICSGEVDVTKFIGRFGINLEPNTDAIRDLGATSNRWRDLRLTRNVRLKDFGLDYNPSLPVTSGLVLHLDAHAITGLNNGESVTQWTDLSGVGNHFTTPLGRGDPTYQTNVVNGKPVVRVTTAQESRTTTNFPAPVTVIYCVRQTGPSAQRLLSSWANNWLLGYWGGAKRQAFFEGWVSPSGTPATDTQWHIYSATIPGTGYNSSAYEDGDLIASNQNGVTGPNGLSLNGGAHAEYSDGDYAEIVVYNRVLSASERTAVENYLSVKWLAGIPTQSFTGALHAEQDNLTDLGQTPYRWRDLHLSRDIYMGGTLQSGNIPGARLEDQAIISAKIAANVIATPHIANQGILSASIGALQIGNAHLAWQGITSGKYAGFSIQAPDINWGAITSGKILSGTQFAGIIGDGRFGLPRLNWTSGKLPLGAGIGFDPTEINVPFGVPSGVIVMWSGLITNIPSGFVICDGNNGTPNLLAKFVEGVATAGTNPGSTGGATSKTTAGHTTPSHTLTVDEMPSHTHPLGKYTTGGSNEVVNVTSIVVSDTPTAGSGIGVTATGGGGGHTHATTTDSIADIRPPYYDIAFIMKT
jgi:hypothetical protein